MGCPASNAGPAGVGETEEARGLSAPSTGAFLSGQQVLPLPGTRLPAEPGGLDLTHHSHQPPHPDVPGGGGGGPAPAGPGEGLPRLLLLLIPPGPRGSFAGGGHGHSPKQALNPASTTSEQGQCAEPDLP